jgi:hypothetical protein
MDSRGFTLFNPKIQKVKDNLTEKWVFIVTQFGPTLEEIIKREAEKNHSTEERAILDDKLSRVKETIQSLNRHYKAKWDKMKRQYHTPIAINKLIEPEEAKLKGVGESSFVEETRKKFEAKIKELEASKKRKSMLPRLNKSVTVGKKRSLKSKRVRR